MASLGTLPVELLHVIAECVSTRANFDNDDYYRSRLIQNDLAALARTNRRFHQVFNPLLYRRDREDVSYALSWAITRSCYPTLEKALSFGYDLNNQLCNCDHATRVLPIDAALRQESYGVLKWLLEHGVNLDFGTVEDLELGGSEKIQRVSDHNTSALHQLLEDDPNEEVALMLLDHGACVYFGRKSSSSISTDESQGLLYTDTALHLAAYEGVPNVVERLIVDGVISVDCKDLMGYTALHQIVSKSASRANIIEMLLRHGADPHTKANGGTKAIMTAIEDGHVENVLALIQAMADPSSSDAAAQPWSHLFLYLILEGLSRRLESHEPADEFEDWEEIKMVIAKLIEHGADFNRPPPPNYIPEDVFGKSILQEFHKFWLNLFHHNVVS
ncbi:hypothetical protein PFICI_13051 [Pestalotiopsis fici W106-1]|uniref:Uncharacterized protein n=1 Tax=Pestalotiopsis fici (strain W106-1 / CGMCC3.15140) TaxID=1229662 RepID=W3WN22_PESFW|nr:uncharacterized protein PFICI_13051 [Pestalotiopsis fici W106-1]ETS74567.1 hypothetical protein PFICI_13051 [Pestalotiopsis fici W106-1]